MRHAGPTFSLLFSTRETSDSLITLERKRRTPRPRGNVWETLDFLITWQSLRNVRLLDHVWTQATDSPVTWEQLCQTNLYLMKLNLPTLVFPDRLAHYSNVAAVINNRNNTLINNAFQQQLTRLIHFSLRFCDGGHLIGLFHSQSFTDFRLPSICGSFRELVFLFSTAQVFLE